MFNILCVACDVFAMAVLYLEGSQCLRFAHWWIQGQWLSEADHRGQLSRQMGSERMKKENRREERVIRR